ncbi:hypothetical protein ADJ73_02995 [Arsenicicoccus sp. oral taxon 190]|nr:hypothetical protein ADJ73_02995 [Arsenicicoccus sp. oral taxon 190]
MDSAGPSTPAPRRRLSLLDLRARLAGSRRNGLMFADTAINALTGVFLVAGAARHLDPRQLAAFSLAQLMVTTMIGILRSAVYGPAMAAQRATGRAVVPADWALAISAPTGVVLSAGLVLLVPGLGADRLRAFLLMAVVAAVVLAQDGLRSALLSRELPAWALVADALTFVALLAPIVLGVMPGSAIGVLVVWAATVGLGLLVSVVGLVRSRHANHVRQSLRSAWTLGRWATLDAVFAAIAYLLPMFMATLYVGNSAAGTYRVLQTALGPLNIIQTTVVTVFGLDAWQTATLEGLRALKRKVNVLFGGLFGLATACAAVGLPVMIAITHLSDSHLSRIALIVAAHGVMTATTTPFLAASLALGYQKFGAIIRFVVLIACVGVSLPVAGARWVPWHDPIGTAMLLSSGFTLAGWMISYAAASRREEALLAGDDRRPVGAGGRKLQGYRGRHRSSGRLDP